MYNDNENIITWCKANVTKVGNKVLIILFLVFVLSIAIVFWVTSFEPSGTELVLKNAYNMEFNGKVDSIYYDKENHNTETAVIHGGYLYGVYSEWEHQIQKGDSLYKRENSYKLIVIKPNNARMVLDYQQLVKSWK